MDSPKLITVLKGHKHQIDHLAYVPSSKMIVSVSNQDGTLFVWNSENGERLSQNKNSRSIHSVGFLPRKNRIDLLTTGRGFCKIWPLLHGSTLARTHEEDHWILTGRTVSLARKHATK